MIRSAPVARRIRGGAASSFFWGVLLILAVACAAGVFVLENPLLYQSPTTPDLSQVSADERPPSGLVSIKGSGPTLPLAQQVRTKKVLGVKTDESVEAEFAILPVGDRLLMLESSGAQGEGPLVGRLSVIPDVLRREIVGPLYQAQPDLRGRLLPWILTVEEPVSVPWWGWIAAAVLGIPGLLLASSGLRRLVAPSSHPTARYLGRFGSWREVAAGVDAEATASATGFCKGEVLVTPHWVLHGHQVMRLEDLAWVCHTPPSEGSQWASVALHTRYEPYTLIMATESDAQALASTLAAAAPWAEVGCQDELSTRWYQDKKNFLAQVEERRSRA